MLRALSAGILTVIAACASSGRPVATGERCAPIVSDTLLRGAPVYPLCGVDTPAKLLSTPIRPQYTPRAGLTCASATVRIVVDAQGRVTPHTDRLIRTNDPALYNALRAELPALRYQPARKDGKPVAQLVDVGWMMVVQVRAPGAASPPPRVSRPNC